MGAKILIVVGIVPQHSTQVSLVENDRTPEARTTALTHTPYTYTAREFDAESGLYYYRARFYDADTGRFISEDPIGFAGGDANLYRYAFNNPVNLVDSDGNNTAVLVRLLELLLLGPLEVSLGFLWG